MRNLWELFMAVLPALISSAATAWLLRRNDREQRLEDMANSQRIMAKAIHAELVDFYELYDIIKLSSDLPWNGGDVAVSHISQKYITVYESQLYKIGILDKEDIPYIIKLYINIKAMIDSRIQLNDLCKEHINYTKKMIAGSLESPYGNMLDAYKIALKYQEEVYKLYPNVLERLEKYDAIVKD